MSTTLDTAETAAEGSLPITPDVPAAVAPFRFSAAATLSPARHELLAGSHRTFLRTASASLSDLLRLEIDLQLDTLQVLTYGALVAERGEENQGVLFRMNPQPGLWLMDLPIALSLLFIERMMGGVGELAVDPARDLTEVEQAILRRMGDALLADYARSWGASADLKPEIVRQVRVVKQARALGHQADDLVLRIKINATIKEAKTAFALLVPMAAVEELLVRSGAAEETAQEQASALAGHANSPMGAVPVTVALRWQGFQLSLRDLESLAPGDVLVLDTRKCEKAVVWIGDKPKFAGRVSREPLKTTLTITETLE